MGIQRTYKCTDCGHTFRFLHHPSNEPPPSFCPGCGVKFDGTPYEPPAAPLILKQQHATPDNVFRMMESSSIARADMAYEEAGGDRNDYNHMHVTDLKDDVREGEIAAKVAPNPVQQMIQQQAPTGLMANAAPNVVMQNYSGLLKSGPAAGHNAVPIARDVTMMHRQKAYQLTKAGEINRSP